MIRIRIALVVWSCLLSIYVFGQHQAKPDTVKRESRIQSVIQDNKVKFLAITPLLQPIPGAPTPFYTFYWEFGDGAYSTASAPEHLYKKEGEHTVQLWTTNNYDNGKPPPSRPQKVPVKKITFNDASLPAALPDAFDLKNNREPVPGEEMVVILSYQNENEYPTQGKLYLFFNEKKYNSDNFLLSEVRTHHNETEIQDTPAVSLHQTKDHLFDGARFMMANQRRTIVNEISREPDDEKLLALNLELEAARANYKTAHVLEFTNLLAKESRNIFYSFTTTPDMLKDTSALITVKGIYVPEKGVDHHKSKTLEMEVVTSHDPNKMSVSDTRLNYRFYRHKSIDFKIRFQNNGEGPARSIKLLVDVPEMYDKHSLKINDMYPVCPICPDKSSTISCLDTLFVNNQLQFHFKNIYLPGSQQKEKVDYDSTKGFVKYTLRIDKNVSKTKTQSQTAIVFDQNDPVITNRATTRFKPGLSIGGKAGYTAYPALKNSRNYFAGITLSPYKSQHGYWQAEVMAGVHTYTDSLYRTDIVSRDGDVLTLFDVSQRNTFTNVVLDVVPLSYRYTINSFLGIGAGVQFRVLLSEKIKQEALHENFVINQKQNQRIPRETLNFNSAENVTDSFNGFQPSPFADLTLGAARIGPTGGIRYVYSFKAPHTQWQFYLLWKF